MIFLFEVFLVVFLKMFLEKSFIKSNFFFLKRYFNKFSIVILTLKDAHII